MIHIRAVFHKVKGFRSINNRFYAICNTDGSEIAIFTNYPAALEVLQDSRKIVSRWQEIPLTPTATPMCEIACRRMT